MISGCLLSTPGDLRVFLSLRTSVESTITGPRGSPNHNVPFPFTLLKSPGVGVTSDDVRVGSSQENECIWGL